ncbi:hypothetical protein [uncultured Marixanthomonas sp.]|uniref:toxin-antitoxin system YwqK family antitoxin n=1 Tax=uncultured Marixanthomonas sp. TaxID=757245 RepID=UPI0030DB9FB7|tara:strand:- start:73303 stop:75816 length:2514 start_codon:yes stop_codon:yes gene_type:complete
MKIQFTIFLLFFTYCSVSKAQNDTLWFNRDWKETNKEKASFYRLPVKKVGKLYSIKDYYIDGTKQMTGFSKYKDSVHLEGKAVWYNKKGEVKESFNYRDNKLNGVGVFYRSEGTRRTPYEITYKNDRMLSKTYFDTDRKGIRFKRIYEETGTHIKTLFYGNNGELIGTYFYSEKGDAKGIMVDYYSDPMRVENINVIQNGQEFQVKSFYPNGNKRSVFDTIQLKKTYYNLKGKTIGAIQYVGKLSELYYDKGNLIEFYHDGQTVKKIETYENGHKTNQKEFNTFGILIREDYFDDNERIKTVTFTDEGKKIGVLENKNDQLNGTIKMRSNNIITYKDNVVTTATIYHPNTGLLFATLKNAVITFYNPSGTKLGTLKVKLEPGRYYQHALENGYSPIPIEGTLYSVDYNQRISAVTEYRSGKIIKKTTYDYEETYGKRKEERFQETKIYDEEEKLIKEIKYFSNGNKRTEFYYDQNVDNSLQKGLFYNKKGEKLAEYDYKTKTGTKYKYFYRSDRIKAIVEKEYGEFIKQKTYQKVYTKNARSHNIILREDIDFNGEAKFYSKEGKLIAEATFEDGEPTGTIYNLKKRQKIEVLKGVKNGVRIEYEDDEKTIEKKGFYRNGKKHGTFINYLYGKKTSEINYKDDVKEGYSIYYDKEGNELSKLLYKEGEPYEGTKKPMYGSEMEYKQGRLVKQIKKRESYREVLIYPSENEINTTIYDLKENRLLTYSEKENQIQGKLTYYKNNAPYTTAIFEDGKLIKGTVWVKVSGRYRSSAYSKLTKNNATMEIKLYNKEDQLIFEGTINTMLYKNYKEMILSYITGVEDYVYSHQLFIKEYKQQ